MSGQWEPGTVAVATVLGVRGVTVMATDNPAYPWIGSRTLTDPATERAFPRSSRLLSGADVADVRPLVVLDHGHIGDAIEGLRVVLTPGLFPPDSDQRAALRELLEAIEAQTRPPKPPEPTGLGAVVKDHKGSLWVKWSVTPRAERNWKRHGDVGGDYRAWTNVDVVEVLSEGVAP